MNHEPIFRTLPGEVLLQLAKILAFNPVISSGPAKLLSDLQELERVKWLEAHRDELENHVSFVGSSLLPYMFGNGKSYREIVVDVADKLGAPHRTQAG